MPDTFGIGTSISVTDLDVLLSAITPIEPDWSYRPFSSVVLLQSGISQGNGFPIIKWRFNQIEQSHREILRETYCPVPKLSNSGIYIRTPISETDAGVLIWEIFKCVMNWPTEEEDFQANRELGLVLTFTHCEVQS